MRRVHGRFTMPEKSYRAVGCAATAWYFSPTSFLSLSRSASPSATEGDIEKPNELRPTRSAGLP